VIHMAADRTNRSTHRSAGVMCRMTPEQREALKLLAADEGVTVQTFILRKVFGQADVQDLPHGMRAGVRRRNEELSMTG
jgi:hypothetical protein